ncbi:MAG: DNA polymerase III subunit alpha [Sarcina sp.]
MEQKKFVHLHVHSGFSLLDGSGKIKNILERTKELGMDAIALTDHGVMYGCVDFYKKAKKLGIKPILGCEVYVVPKSMTLKQNDSENKTHHLVLLVKNEAGYQNLMKIVSAASIDGFYYKPRVDREFLKAHSEGLIALSACMGGEVQRAIINGNIEKAKEAALFYKDTFKDGFYLELQNHGIEEQRKVNEVNIELSKELDIPLVATNDLHYIYEEDFKAHDILLCIQTGKTIHDEKRMRYGSDQFYIKSPEEMWEMFSYIPEALENTVKIANECNYDYEFHVSKLPKYPLPDGEEEAYEYLVKTCFGGLIERYEVFNSFTSGEQYKEVIEFAENNEEAKELVDRLLYELGVIKQMGYVDYFLIVWDFIKYAIDNGIPTGPGRGCFVPGTKILKSDGSIANIESFKGGEEVVTALGHNSIVETLLHYDVEEEIIKIESSNETLELTMDHKVLAINNKVNNNECEDKSDMPVVCKKMSSLDKDSKYIESPFKEYSLEWIEAKNLNENDLIVYPRTKENSKIIRYDLLDYCKETNNIKYNDTEIWNETSKNTQEVIKVNRFIEFSEDLFKIFGYFIEKGFDSLNKKSGTYNIGLEFNLNEIDHINSVVNLLKKVFNAEAKVCKYDVQQSILIDFNSKILDEFFKQKFIIENNNKIIPSEVIRYASNDEIKVLLAKIFKVNASYSDISDGNALDRIEYVNTSEILIRQIKLLLARAGYWGVSSTRFEELETEYEKYSVRISGRQLLNWNNDFMHYEIPIKEEKFYKDNSFYMDEDYFYIKIKNISKRSYKGKVYDISVPGDTSYVANSIAVHNSAAGSIVAYTLGITKIDPIKYSLLFERFLNPERVSMPDIDSDFCYERRQEVIDYVVEKYGETNVSQIITFGTMAPRACIRDVGRAMNYTYGEVDRIAKMIPTVLGISIDKALELNPELKDAYDTEDRVKELIDVARRLEGLPRHSSTHAAGVVIASKPLVEYVPLQKNDESIVTQFDMTTLEELGLLKMDFLGLRTLTVMADAVKMIKENRNVDIDLDSIDFEDAEIYKMIGEGKTAGVFQLESAGMTSFMKELKPDNFEDIIAGISLYRPGPMAEIPRYIEGKKSPENVKYMDDKLEDILDVTYGVMVYQEQVMEIVRKLAGYSMGRSDLVRRAMSKKKHDVMEEERKNFIYGVTDKDGNVEVEGCQRNGISVDVANKIFDSMMDFASYAFNKSHAAAYAVVGYQTAFLMRYYPVEFLAAMLNSVMGISEKVAEYIRTAKELGIEVLPPSINESYSKFTVKGNSIRFGLAAIKNVGVNVVDAIVEARNEKGKFTSLMNFCNKLEVGAINKRAVESLIKAGAFDEFGVFRSKLISVHERLLDGISSQKKKNIDGQISLFGALAQEDTQGLEIKYENINEFPKKVMLAMEKEMTGLYITGHPLDEYKESLKAQTSVEISKLLEEKRKIDDTTDEMIEANISVNDGDKVVIGGILSNVSRKVTRNNTLMAFATLEDLSGMIELVVFPKTLERCNSLVHDDLLVVVRGRVSFKEEEDAKILCEEIKILENINAAKLYIRVEDTKKAKDINLVLKHVLEPFSGDTPVYIVAAKERQTFRLARECWVNLDKGIVKFLEDKFGQENVKLVE